MSNNFFAGGFGFPFLVYVVIWFLPSDIGESDASVLRRTSPIVAGCVDDWEDLRTIYHHCSP
jgi:hypothetical protein